MPLQKFINQMKATAKVLLSCREGRPISDGPINEEGGLLGTLLLPCHLTGAENKAPWPWPGLSAPGESEICMKPHAFSNNIVRDFRVSFEGDMSSAAGSTQVFGA